ncbi:MAG: hypothetical protein ACD_17C00518G0005 [uncultured bacterium]|nr:MAG: hypothetical protein ACD_17C00518G0005 [uncultured bacterium]OGN55400.1 MAG: hypothetical protein A2796_02595 [Chlamydiae bacterium RIFCSPHIGHO2_01_FULL_44_39]OGN58723.1 MAG: hypothetical protein A3C42_05675 [Chlamydiae bacterium RIFCSPHIGHO2_02_FULL_45_9]OGN59904.1 MAG: hypothetical protein A3D96_03910 [Chlamydiae bacterium RIFCSPHIGHO2_12_FULL_44_59]OGN66111.1 MAG: hypothetical protein A2978_04425 [Chlamydiae bacterium RIFCSPLOWO2_01_FULL_44_52]OGN68646.1 MAG: hypothetical protein A3
MACSGLHKSRLFVGEGTFSGVESLLNKHENTHPNLGYSITATELRSFNRTSDNCLTCDSLRNAHDEETSLLSAIANLFLDTNGIPGTFCSDLCRKIESLRNRGVTVILAHNATQIHIDPRTIGKIFKRIHWNCPHDGSNYNDQTLPPIIQNFFVSASFAQRDEDEVHVTLAQPQDGWDKSPFYQAVVYDIVRAAQQGNYGLRKKRNFGPARYPGYQHEQTNRPDSALGASQQRQFVFVKGKPNSQNVRFNFQTFKIGQTYSNRPFYIASTDNDSSGYSAAEEKED